MSDATLGSAEARRALAEISRHTLVPWLAHALDLLERNLELLPPVEVDDREIIDHLYPH